MTPKWSASEKHTLCLGVVMDRWVTSRVKITPASVRAKLNTAQSNCVHYKGYNKTISNDKEDSSADRAAVRTQMAKMQQDMGSNPVPPNYFFTIKKSKMKAIQLKSITLRNWRGEKKGQHSSIQRWHCYTYLWS